MKAWLMALVVLGGCFTARASVGPDVASSGRGGMTATAGYGFGWSWRGQQAIYLSAGGGVVETGFARATVGESLDYVNHAGPLPVRVSARYAELFGRERYDVGSRSMVGIGIAFFPWHGRAGSDGGARGEKDVDLLPDTSLDRGLGVELAIDALPGTAMTPATPAERTAAMITIGLVVEADGMLDR